MTARKRRNNNRPSSAQSDSKELRQETIRFINACLDKEPVDVHSLRELAISRGFVNSLLRAKVWPVLLNCGEWTDEEYDTWTHGEHRDSSVVEADLQRSLWAFTEGWSEEAREDKRRELRHVLTGVVCQHKDNVFYYQGLHDIASVLLFVAGERTAFAMLSAMATCHLRDCTRPTLDAVLESLHLLPVLISQCDEEVFSFIDDSGIPPFFALSWFITWFSHNLQDLQQISRLFDILLASHPLMPLYCTAVIVKASRSTVLAAEDPSELHRALANLPVLDRISADELAKEAYQLKKSCPPERLLLLSGMRMQRSTAAEAVLKDECWIVPEKKVPFTGLLPRIQPLEHLQNMLRDPEKRKKLLHTAFRTRLGIVTGLVLIVSALAASQAWQ